MEKEDKALICKLTESIDFTKNYSISVNYICNSDGTIRWMYSDSLKEPTFLKFYSSATFKSKIFSFFAKALFKIKVFNILFSKKMNLIVQEGSFVDQINKKYRELGYSIFFGTVGVNRKIIFHLNKHNEESSFIKFAVSKKSLSLIKNETLFLAKISDLPIKNIFFPKLISYPRSDAIEITDIKPKKSFQPARIDRFHIDAVININSINRDIFKWNELSSFNNFDKNFVDISNKEITNNDIKTKFVDNYIESAKLAISFIDIKRDVLCGLSHGDFTPWNMYSNRKNQLFIYDWELAKINVPIFFDLFHFVFQSNVLLNNNKFHDFKKELIKLQNDQVLNTYIEENKININENYIFYIIYISSYYLNIYLEQENIHKQAIWQLDCWHEALLDVIRHDGKLVNEE